MKHSRMKGKSVEDAKKAALEVLGGSEDNAVVRVLSEGKSGLLGIGGSEAEVEVILKEGVVEDSRQILQEILDRMGLMAMVEAETGEGGASLAIKGEDMGRIIGQDGATIQAFEIVVRAILARTYEERVFVSIDAGDYKKKRNEALERVAKDAADEVEQTGQEKVLPLMSAADRRIIHMSLQANPKITTFSKGEGRDRRLVIAPK